MVDSGEALSPPADTMRERVGDSRPKVWFLIDGNRWVVAGILLGISFVVITLGGLLFPRPFETALTTSSIRSLFQSIFLATVTSIALTLTIGQLILSEEMGDLGEQRSRMQDEIQFRKDVQTSMDVGVPPATPTGFLRTLLLGARQDATALGDQVAEEPDSEAAAEVERFATLIDEHGKQVMGDLENAEFGTFETLSGVLDFNYSWKTRTARRLRGRHAEDLSPETDRLLEELVQNLSLFGPARQYFKLLYYQHELIDVSRVLLYTAMPALGLTTFMGFAFDVAPFSGTVAGLDVAFVLVSFVIVLSLFPFALLLSFVLRMVTVSQRTLTIGPFILREEEDAEDIGAVDN